MDDEPAPLGEAALSVMALLVVLVCIGVVAWGVGMLLIEGG